MTTMARKLLLAFLLIFVSLMNVHAQWSPTNGPTGGFMEWVISNNNTLYTTAYGTGAVYASTDLGAHWSLFAAVDDFSSMVILGQTYLATTTQYALRGKIWRSTDGGKNWVNVIVAAGHQVFCLNGTAQTFFCRDRQRCIRLNG